MRVDPRLQAEVTQINWLPVRRSPAPEAQAPDLPRLHGDVSALTRGTKGAIPFAKTRLTRRNDPTLDPDDLALSERWKKARQRLQGGSDAAEVADAASQLDAWLQDLARRKLTDGPQYRQIKRLRESLGRIAEREAKREQQDGSHDRDPDHETFDDLWDRLLAFTLGPGALKAKDQQRYSQALLLMRAGKKDEAIRLLKRVVGHDPEHVDAQAKLGKLLVDRERYDEAEQHLQTAAIYRPQDFDLNLGMGEMYYHLGEEVLARQAFFNASMAKRQHADPHAWLGVMAYEGGDIKGAAESLERAVQLDPGHAVARFYLAQVAYQLNDPLRGEYQIKMVQRLEPLADLERFAATKPLLAAGPTRELEGHRWGMPRSRNFD